MKDLHSVLSYKNKYLHGIIYFEFIKYAEIFGIFCIFLSYQMIRTCQLIKIDSNKIYWNTVPFIHSKDINILKVTIILNLQRLFFKNFSSIGYYAVQLIYSVEGLYPVPTLLAGLALYFVSPLIMSHDITSLCLPEYALVIVTVLLDSDLSNFDGFYSTYNQLIFNSNDQSQ